MIATCLVVVAEKGAVVEVGNDHTSVFQEGQGGVRLTVDGKLGGNLHRSRSVALDTPGAGRSVIGRPAKEDKQVKSC